MIAVSAKPNLKLRSLARPSGALAMLAIDQRESMRAMFAEKQAAPVTNDQITGFKLAALRALTPIASAVLIDRPFAWKRAIAESAVSPGCGLIAAMDHFIEGRGELITDVVIDEAFNPIEIRADGGVALKLLIIWRPDEPAERRVALADDFISRCRDAGLISIIEPVSRKPHDGRTWDLGEGILAAAKELGNRGADLYKAEVPRYGKGGEAAVRAGCAVLTRVIQSPWVVLSSGVAPDDFPVAVEWACREGASGFLAGRAVWRGVVGTPNTEEALVTDAVPRLQALCDVVDRVVSG
ncbi:aldolase [Acidisoma sp. L85]|uniref:aldolase n=1 Tax=Acidisoma sp. L85 TaxID=1641850 RepID=UPI00131DAE5E|nr:aldolase [Acidisoma sp. L85]